MTPFVIKWTHGSIVRPARICRAPSISERGARSLIVIQRREEAARQIGGVPKEELRCQRIAGWGRAFAHQLFGTPRRAGAIIGPGKEPDLTGLRRESANSKKRRRPDILGVLKMQHKGR